MTNTISQYIEYLSLNSNRITSVYRVAPDFPTKGFDVFHMLMSVILRSIINYVLDSTLLFDILPYNKFTKHEICMT